MARRYWLLLLVVLQPGCLLTDPAKTVTKPPEVGELPPADSARACKAVAESLAAQGHHAQAVDQLLKARGFDPACDVAPDLARLYAKLGDDRRALDEFDRAIATHPGDADLCNDLGYYQYQRGNWAEAEANFRKAIADDRKHTRAWMNLGLSLAQQERYPDSLEAFEKAVRPAEARCNLAFVVLAQGKRDKARELYNEALKLDPGLELPRRMLAKIGSSS